MVTAKSLDHSVSCLDAALEAIDAGLSVIPVSPRKTPFLPCTAFSRDDTPVGAVPQVRPPSLL